MEHRLEMLYKPNQTIRLGHTLGSDQRPPKKQVTYDCGETFV